MSKTVYLLGHTGAFLQWCPGCVVRTEQSDVIMARNPAGFKVELCKITPCAAPYTPGEGFGEPGFTEAQNRRNRDWACRIQGAKASWLQAIIAAPEGALLRWDNERGCVVDELAPDEEAFEGDSLLSVDECFEGVAESFEETAGPEYQRCTECNCPLVVFHGEVHDGGVCISPYCSLAVSGYGIADTALPAFVLKGGRAA